MGHVMMEEPAEPQRGCGQDDFCNPLFSVIPATFIILTHPNLVFYVFHRIYIRPDLI